jgi:hypothetical protein
MRKLTRKSLDELAKVMPVISEEEQRNYVGGTDSSYYYGTGYYGDTGYFGDTGYYGGSGYSVGSEYGVTGYYDGIEYYAYLTGAVSGSGVTITGAANGATGVYTDQDGKIYNINSDGTYYVTGPNGTIYGRIPEVTVTYVQGGTRYQNTAFYYQAQNNLITNAVVSGALTTAIGAMSVPISTVVGTLGLCNDVNLRRFNNLLFSHFGDNQSFWLKSDYGRISAYDLNGNFVFQYNTTTAF